MFLIMGINNGRKVLDFSQLITCPCCRRSGRMEVIKTYTYFMLFFIPLFRWNKRYFVNMSCCGAVCEIDKELGRAIEKGEVTYINPDTLNFTGSSCGSGYDRAYYNERNSYGNGKNPYGEGPISSRANMNRGQAAGPDFADSYIDPDGLHRVKVKSCDNCGYETGEDFEFCPKCGKKF